MSHYLVNQAGLKGEIKIPSSKSHTLRAILLGSLGTGKSLVYDYLPSTDAQAMIEACRCFGAKIQIFSEKLEITGIKGSPEWTEDVIDAGNSGIVLRFCSAIGGLAKHPVVITGDESIRHQRPMNSLLKGLSQLGASAVSMRGDGYAPVIIQGPIQPGKVVIHGEDSQPVSALLIASAFVDGPVELIVKNPGEIPWVSLTLDWLKRLGIFYENEGFNRYRLLGKNSYEGFNYSVPGDFSSAAFPLAAALITESSLTLTNLDIKDSQGDKELIFIFQKMGALIEFDGCKKCLHVKKGGTLKGIQIDVNPLIDALPILAVVACFAEGETHLYNAAIAKQKECNRLHCITTELSKMGADIKETNDGLWIKKSCLKGTRVHSFHDHRIAMSLTIAGLASEGTTVISSVECVSKTFPTFMHDFNRLGAGIRYTNDLNTDK